MQEKGYLDIRLDIDDIKWDNFFINQNQMVTFRKLLNDYYERLKKDKKSGYSI